MKSEEIITKIEDYLEDLENMSNGPESLPALACGNIRDLLKEFLAPAERWETVEDWEKRTGKVYPDDGPVWYKIGNMKDYELGFNNNRRGYSISGIILVPLIGHGKPPSEGKGEEG